MADDLTATLPRLTPRPEDVQAELDRQRLLALGGGAAAGAQRLGAAALDLGTMPARGVMGAANTLIRLPNALGANIPFIPESIAQSGSLTPYSDRLNQAGVPFGPAQQAAATTAPAVTTPAPVAAAALPVAPQMSAPVADTVPTAAPVRAAATGGRVSAAGGTGGAGGTARSQTASMPAGAPAPLIPGETGFYIGDKLVPYGTTLNLSGAGESLPGGGNAGGSAPGIYDNLPGGGKRINGRFVDPRDALEVGFRMQAAYRDDSMRQILALAGNGGDLGFRAKISALAQAFGQNNFASVGVGGANALNSAIASLEGAQAGAGATLGAARIRSQDNAANLAEQGYQFDTTPKAVGQTSVTDPLTGLSSNQTSYALPAPRGSGGMPQIVQPEKPKAALTDGTVGYDRKTGKATVVKDGKWVYQ